MSNQEILDLLKRALCELEPRCAAAARTLELDSSLLDLGLDSLSITAAAGVLEKNLSIRLPDEELAALFDIPAFIAAIRRQLPTSGKDSSL